MFRRGGFQHGAKYLRFHIARQEPAENLRFGLFVNVVDFAANFGRSAGGLVFGFAGRLLLVIAFDLLCIIGIPKPISCRLLDSEIGHQRISRRSTASDVDVSRTSPILVPSGDGLIH